MKADGTILAWGSGASGENTVPAGLNRLNLAVTVRGSVNPDVPDTYALNYTANCAAGAVTTATRAVMVTDTKWPVLTLTGANPLSLDIGTPFVDPSATANDLCAGNLTTAIVRGGTVNAALPGNYTLTYTVSDSSGNTVSTNRTVLVRGGPSACGCLRTCLIGHCSLRPLGWSGNSSIRPPRMSHTGSTACAGLRLKGANDVPAGRGRGGGPREDSSPLGVVGTLNVQRPTLNVQRNWPKAIG